MNVAEAVDNIAAESARRNAMYHANVRQRRVRARRGGNLTQTPSRRRSNRERRPAARVDVYVLV